MSAKTRHFPSAWPSPQRRQLRPALADVDAERVEAPQQRRGVGQAERHRALGRADRPVIEGECGIVLPELEVEQRPVPPDMNLVHVAGGRPQRLARQHPAQPVFRAPGHFHHMRHGVMRPEAQRLELGGGARLVLGAGIVARFLEPEAVKSEQRPVARLFLRPQWQGPRRAVPHQGKRPRKPSISAARLVRHQVERVMHQVAVEHRDRGGARPLHQMRECCEMGLLALVQRSTTGRFRPAPWPRPSGRGRWPRRTPRLFPDTP